MGHFHVSLIFEWKGEPSHRVGCSYVAPLCQAGSLLANIRQGLINSVTNPLAYCT
jgi:hypothetical protein